MSPDVNPFDAPQERSQSRHHSSPAVGPLLLLGTICFLLPVFIQTFEVRYLSTNSSTNIGLVVLGFGSIGYSFFLFRSFRNRKGPRNLPRRRD